ncbi:HAD family phosphatase [Paraburkholderia sp.]|jgi:putative hydrolase of the HAD superfamily|uniref:HAD family hydrolase n=1 Tax=Paraburkholderia sp. TaxID=1926495 RepID=UPI002F41E0F6
MTSPLSLILFDLDDVLCRYDRSARIAHIAARVGRDAQAVRQAIWDSGLEGRADAGQVSDAGYISELGALLAYPLTVDDWLDARRAGMTPDAEVIAIAKAVARRHRVAVLTNNCCLLADHIHYLCPPVAEVFGAQVYASASFGAAKPSPDLYRRCVQHLKVAPGETLFIDDVEANVAGAVEAGLRGYRFTGTEALASELAAHGLL